MSAAVEVDQRPHAGSVCRPPTYRQTRHQIEPPPKAQALWRLAEGVGFEPTQRCDQMFNGSRDLRCIASDLQFPAIRPRRGTA